MDDTPPILVWLRDDLRLADNPALAHAAGSGAPVVVAYLLEEDARLRPPGGAARWWLHHSLAALAAALAEKGSALVLRRGPARTAIPALARESGARTVAWNRRYGHAATVDAEVAAALQADGIALRTFKANLLFEPEEVRTRGGDGFRVYSAFWRAATGDGAEPRPPIPAPARLRGAARLPGSDALDSWALLPRAPDWAGGIRAAWTPGEAAASARLAAFVEAGLAAYAERRDLPGEAGTSRLSPHLRFGEVSPFQVWHAAAAARERGTGKFLAEIGWREFAWHVLAGFPDLATQNLRPEFDRFPWRDAAPGHLEAWRRGRTGYPIVDAGMRELWTTGWMHNRVRMIVASFLAKHLLADWRQGETWFFDTLVDADAASNPFGWQWVAGSGADAQPYFRIFNAVLQGEKFDPRGAYVRRWVPELATLSDSLVHRPWEATPLELAAAGIRPGADYPAPLVDHAAARERALAAFQAMRGRT